MENFIVSRQQIEGKIVDQAKSLATKLNQEIEKGNDDTAFFIAFGLALFKDFLDVVLTFLFIGLVPGVSFAVGLFLTSFLFFFMLGKGYFLKWRLRLWFWVFGLLIDGFPVLSTLPTNSLLVLYAWRLAKKRAKKAKIKLKNLHSLTTAEINSLNEDISLLEKREEWETSPLVGFITGNYGNHPQAPSPVAHAPNKKMATKSHKNIGEEEFKKAA